MDQIKQLKVRGKIKVKKFLKIGFVYNPFSNTLYKKYGDELELFINVYTGLLFYIGHNENPLKIKINPIFNNTECESKVACLKELFDLKLVKWEKYQFVSFLD